MRESKGLEITSEMKRGDKETRIKARLGSEETPLGAILSATSLRERASLYLQNFEAVKAGESLSRDV